MAHVVSGGPGGSFDTAGPGSFAPYSPKDSTWSPYHFKTALLNYGGTSGPTTIEVTPTMHGAVFKASFPPCAAPAANPDQGYSFNQQTRRLLVALEQPELDSLNFTTSDNGSDNFVSFAGTSTSNSGGVPEGFGHHFFATVSGGGSRRCSGGACGHGRARRRRLFVAVP
mmetsp:Transcript_9981/g.19660  ORF Transcript_9981/g.19660 Transcript_9981/m.19660 type:complete len:169 (+) Transcript_9981:141-647(+)